MSSDDHIRPERLKFMAQLVFQVVVDGQTGGGDGRHNRHRDQRRQGPVFAHPCCLNQEPRKKLLAAHASPRSTTAGSKRMALRTAPALPANVTMSAATIVNAITTGWTSIADPKIVRRPASVRNSVATVPLLAPRDFIKPTSLRRSRIVAAMAAETASAAARSAAIVSSSIIPEIRLSTLPWVCSTCRICSTRTLGSASLIWKAMEFAYGEQYQRSRSAGVILLGSRRPNASSGLVRAL